MNVVHYNTTPDHSEQITEHEAVKQKDEETLKKDRQEDVQLPNKLEVRRLAFMKMLAENERL